MRLNFSGEISEVKQGLKFLEGKLGYILHDDGIVVNVIQGKRLYVSIQEDEINLEYSLKVEFFRALSILLHNLKQGNNNFTFEETRKIDKCGIMFDVSRNAVLTASTVKDFIARMARMGLNTLMLYTEDIYKLEGHPYFGYMRGAYTKEELKDISSFADAFGVEMIPCIQTLGHLEKPLRWPAFSHVKGTNKELMVDEPKTYEFIEDMIRHMRECHNTTRIHLGMDEASGLGLGRYLNEHGYHDEHDLMVRHLKKVVEIAKKYDFEPMIWGDMYFRMNNERPSADNADYENPNLKYRTNLNSGELQYYNPNIDFAPGTADMIPEDVTIIYWDYYNINPEIYRGMIRKNKELSSKIMFAGGIWTWNGITPCYGQTMYSTRPALEMCHEEGINEVLACIWRDNGEECNVYSTLLGMQLFAEHCYHEKVDDAKLSDMFYICTGYDMEGFLSLDIDTGIQGLDDLRATVSTQALYQDILLGLFDKNFALVDLKTHYKAVGEKLRSLKNQGDMEPLFDFQRQLVLILETKCDMGIRLTEAYHKNDRETLQKISQEIDVLIPQLEKFHQMSAEIWYNTNKPFGFNVIDIRHGGLLSRVKRAKVRIDDYLSGKISELEELSEPRLYYNGRNTAFIHDPAANRVMNV